MMLINRVSSLKVFEYFISRSADRNVALFLLAITNCHGELCSIVT